MIETPEDLREALEALAAPLDPESRSDYFINMLTYEPYFLIIKENINEIVETELIAQQEVL